MNGTKFGHVSFEAVKHMIGQTQELSKRGATLSEVASWLNVSKPTAKRFMGKMNYSGIRVRTDAWRVNKKTGQIHSTRDLYALSYDAKREYENGNYYENYKLYVSARRGER